MSDFDFSDLTKLSEQVKHIGDELPRGARAAMRVAEHTTKDAWQDSLERSDFPASATAIWYRNPRAGDGQITGTIEASRGTARMRGYVHAREYGSPTVTPVGDARRALEVGAADLEVGAAIAGQRAIERALSS